MGTRIGDTLGNNATTIAVFTASGYNSLEMAYQAGDDFKVGGFGAAVQNKDPVHFESADPNRGRGR